MMACYLSPPSTAVPFTVDYRSFSASSVPLSGPIVLALISPSIVWLLTTNQNRTLIVFICISGWELILFYCDWPLWGQKRATGEGTGKLKFNS